METRRGLSGGALKYLAAAFMLADHMGVVLDSVLGTSAAENLLYYLLRCVGRIAFPIFLFFVAEGCHKTGNFPKYLLRLGIFAALSQIPFSLMVPGAGGSVILTFLLGALSIYGFERLREKRLVLAALPLLLACVLAIFLNTDYGFPAVLLLFALYLCGEDRKRQLTTLSVGLALIYLVYNPLTELLSSLPVLWSPFVGSYLRQTMPLCALYFLLAMVAVLLLSRYSGARGRGSRWFFYLFYPGHMLALFLLRALLL